MTRGKVWVFLCVLSYCNSDWVSEWMTPVQGQLFEDTPDSYRRSGTGKLKQYEDEYERMLPLLKAKEPDNQHFPQKTLPTIGLKMKLEVALENAKALADVLAKEISEVTEKERVLKETIVQGRSGVTKVTVYAIGQLARNYIIRDGVWTLCTGAVHTPPSNNGHGQTTTCLGQEVITKPDPCVFHSVTKYETIPTRRRMHYVEDEFLCLKPSFNITMDYYMSVPRKIINETCHYGTIRSLEDNLLECGQRVLSEYSYFPIRGYSLDLPLEYCLEEDGSCKLIVAWHISNTTIENFEFLKNEPNFKKFFLKLNYF